MSRLLIRGAAIEGLIEYPKEFVDLGSVQQKVYRCRDPTRTTDE